MANATIGHIDCPFGGGRSEVRKDKKGKLYYYNENTGMVKPNLSLGQKYMRENTVFIGDNGKPLTPVDSVNEKSPSDDSVNENEPVKTSWVDKFLTD